MSMDIPRKGIHRTTYPSGKVFEEFQIRDGEHHGVQRSWHENGQLSSEYHTLRGVMNGRMRWWAEDGMLFGQKYYFDSRPISKKGYHEKCELIPELPRFEDDKPTNTLRNFVRQERQAKDEAAKFPPTPEALEDQAWFENECKLETKEKDSKELLKWLGAGKKLERELGELTRSKALRLARKIYSLGATKIWATRIERDGDGAEYSKRMIIALPKDAESRGKIYKLCSNQARPTFGGESVAIRVGNKYMSVSLL